MEDNKFFSFIVPLLKYIDNGEFFKKPFSWLYYAFALINTLLPFYVLYELIDLGAFDAPAKFVFLLIFLLLLLFFASWIGAQLWWNRVKQLNEAAEENASFVGIPVFSHFIQTLGEWLGFMIAILGTGGSLFIALFGGANLLGFFKLEILSYGLIGVIICPIYGFLVLVGGRVTAELIRALAAIANNTKKQ